MAGVTFCFSSSLGASSCPLDFAPLPRWRNFVFACPMSAHFSRVLNRKFMKKIMYSGSARRSSIVAAAEVPDFLPAAWAKPNKPIGPKFDLSAEQVTLVQLNALQDNDNPYTDHGIEVMYRFAGFDPFKRSEYFGPLFDLGQFERFRRILHHTSFRVLLGHTDRDILSSLFVNEHCFKQRVRIVGARPGEEEVYEFTLVQRVGGNWDGYWLTESLRHDGEGASGGVAY
ncbi:hypothetical protein M758_2G155800 [Ceratodon purpureus]|nr:hypothetical protein M758_2G155800 [Ceratodon purpureus]